MSPAQLFGWRRQALKRMAELDASTMADAATAPMIEISIAGATLHVGVDVGEEQLRRVIRAQRTALDEFSGRHERSSAKKKNGGLRDLRKNLFKATRKGAKKIKLV